ncbi:MAG: hypothetical protein JW759_04675 [Candidatus Coatesbacteria bacterium]|nr:hypothetical protein [Candidatus Coatesbacteria bacterium]
MQPLKAFEYNMSRVDGLLKIRKEMSRQQGKARPRREVSDLLRSALVLAVSAFDAYCHDCLASHARDGLIRTLSSAEWPPQLQDFIKEHFKAHELCKMFAHADPQGELVEAFVGCFDSRSFQDVGRIEKVFSFLGIRSICEEVAKKVGLSRDELTGRIAEIFGRRHSIAHSGDYEEGAQGRPKQKPIKASQVEAEIAWLRQVTRELDSFVTGQLGPGRS